jgi:membrane-bound serine protease (ClpP class)
MQAKETNTLVSDITNLASRRGPKAVDWAQRAVKEAATATADEALQIGVIDAVADNLPDLLAQLDGRQVTVAGRQVTLQLGDRPVTQLPLNPIEGFLNTIANPTIAAILLSLGSMGLIFELQSPGAVLPGVAGAICLLLGFYALGVLEANWVGLGFMALALLLFVLDVKAPTHGLLTGGGILSFILGGFILFNTPDLEVPWASLILSALAMAAFFGFAVAKAIAAQRRRPTTGFDALIGQTAEVRQELCPEGMVFLQGELWVAHVDDGSIPAGERVVVVGRDGLRLLVQRAA